MSLHFASPELSQLVSRIQEKQLSGCVSLDHFDRSYRRYGTLQFQKGRLTGADYFKYEGTEALSMIKNLPVLSLSFAAGAVVFR